MAKKLTKLPIGKLPTNDYPSPCTAVSPKRSQEDIARERRYRAEDALRDIERVKKYEGDKQLMNDVKSLAREKMNSLKKLV